MTGSSALRAALLAGSIIARSSFSPAQTGKPAPSFEVVSVHASRDDEALSFGDVPNGFSARHTPLSWIILEAYSDQPLSYMRQSQILNAPEWVFKEPLDIEARVDDRTAEAFKSADTQHRMDVLRPMLQAFLQDRCGIVVHRQEHQDAAYALVSTGHLKLTPSAPGLPTSPNGINIGDGAFMSHVLFTDSRGLRFQNTSLPQFAEVLSGLGTESDLPIIDRTDLPGRYDFTLMKLEDTSTGDQPNPPAATHWDIGGLGLRLKRITRPLPFIVVDQVRKPGPN